MSRSADTHCTRRPEGKELLIDVFLCSHSNGTFPIWSTRSGVGAEERKSRVLLRVSVKDGRSTNKMVDDENEQLLNIWSVYNTQRGSPSL